MSLLSIVVTCTDRKAVASTPGLRVRDLPPGDAHKRTTEWKRRVAAADQRLPLSQLYQGDHWTRARLLSGAATTAGFTPSLWVASAGLGLRPASDSAPAYAATFSPRHADSVASSPEGCAQWWRLLRENDTGEQLKDLAGRGQLMLVLSDAYANAMAEDIHRLGDLAARTLLIGGTQDFPGLTRVPADASLRHALGGTLTSLNARMAAAWLAHCTAAQLTSPETSRSWQSWVTDVSKQERYDRTPLSNEKVIEFIREYRALHPGCSRTRLLRELRSQGLACEQKRFANLYTTTVENE